MQRYTLVLPALLGLLIAADKAPAAPRSLETRTLDISSKAGVPWEFKPEGGDWKPIQTPAGGWRAQGITCDAGTYRARIPIPPAVHGIVRLSFAAVNFGAEVYAGKDDAHLTKVAAHINGWMPFTADVTPLATPGSLLLVQVEVKGRRKFMHNGRYTVPEGATWYPGLAEGILRGVALEILPGVRIDDVYVRTSISPDVLNTQITVRNDSDQPAAVTLSSRLTSVNKMPFRYPRISDVTAMVPPHASQPIDLGQVDWPAGKASYWLPNVPYRSNYKAQLHLLETTLKVNGVATHTARQRFGFRQFAVKGNHYELNGVRCNLRGDNQQEADFGTDAYGIQPGFGPPSAGNSGWPQAVDNLLRLQFNVMRIHQIPATPYMLDVCDEQGLMLVDESPLRGSEGGEDYQAGKENMLNMDRELALRDRNHPSVVIWSAANEWSDPIRDAMKVIKDVDDTRPIIADGVGDMGPDVINMEHYKNGGGLPLSGGSPRADRPYGETESVWPSDSSWQGFAWMATGTRLRRLKGDSDLRNYVLNNAWPNYVPGEGPENEVLEIKVKNMDANAKIHEALADPWHHPNIHLMQQCYNPVAACDTEFDRANARSNKKGEWPVIKPHLAAGTHTSRQIAVFNDEFQDQNVELVWQLRQGGNTGPLLNEGVVKLDIPLGEFKTTDIGFDVPKMEGDVALILTTRKAGHICFTEDAMRFEVGSAAGVTEGDYRLLNAVSGLPAEVRGAAVVQGENTGKDDQIWHLKPTDKNEFMLVNKRSGQALTVEGDETKDGALAVQKPADGTPRQVWRIEALDGYYTITNKATGKLFDVYASNTAAGAKIVIWMANGGQNQLWEFKRVSGKK